ncbi:HPP family-domain-containing protein [Nemania sp. FL0916]|nr:HPP family-domain-containing protein [Nemania sp. FL0916]
MAPLWQWSFNIDNYLNHIIPPPPWQVIPYPIAYFLGYRKRPPEKKYGSLLLTVRALLGAFTSLVLIQVLTYQVPWVALNDIHVLASFGAAAVLEFSMFGSPVAQPRSFIGGQIIACLVGVSLSKLFQLGSDAYWARWLAGALACTITILVMDLTNTVHPPAGATALLAVIDDSAVGIGWRLIPLVLLSCSIMLFVALIVNNVFTRFPLYWWTASELAARPAKELTGLSVGEEEMNEVQPTKIIILQNDINVPDHIQLTPEERDMLEQIALKL